jgi:hypothetical protein
MKGWQYMVVDQLECRWSQHRCVLFALYPWTVPADIASPATVNLAAERPSYLLLSVLVTSVMLQDCLLDFLMLMSDPDRHVRKAAVVALSADILLAAVLHLVLCNL